MELGLLVIYCLQDAEKALGHLGIGSTAQGGCVP